MRFFFRKRSAWPDKYRRGESALILEQGAYSSKMAALSVRRRFHDWIGLNHYFTRRIDGDGRLIPGFADPVELGHEVSGLKWELRPESLAEIAKDFLGKRRPIYITEHGLATDDDAQRERFLVASLKALQALVETDAEARRWVRGYFHWSLLDNFEWADGFTPHFGLIAVNYATQARTPRPSALRYHEIIKKNAV
jgi:beta-glucosidase